MWSLVQHSTRVVQFTYKDTYVYFLLFNPTQKTFQNKTNLIFHKICKVKLTSRRSINKKKRLNLRLLTFFIELETVTFIVWEYKLHMIIKKTLCNINPIRSRN